MRTADSGDHDRLIDDISVEEILGIAEVIDSDPQWVKPFFEAAVLDVSPDWTVSGPVVTVVPPGASDLLIPTTNNVTRTNETAKTVTNDIVSQLLKSPNNWRNGNADNVPDDAQITDQLVSAAPPIDVPQKMQMNISIMNK